MSDISDFAALAERMADAARPIIKNYFRSDTDIIDKADATPVTAADREAEAAIRGIIEKECPDHGIFGEEFGRVRDDAKYVWVLDPIDGTKAFATGKPLFGTLIALTRNGMPIVGVIDQPILEERWVGAEGQSSTLNGTAVSVRPCAAVPDAWMYTTTPYMFEGEDVDAFKRLAEQVKHPLFGADCYAYGLLAAGMCDLVCEADLKPYDYCALVPIIEGAGGVITDWQGQALHLDSDGRVLAAGDERAHALALDVLNS